MSSINLKNKIAICLSALQVVIASVNAQFNPGYIGSKNAVSVDFNANYGAVWSSGSYNHYYYGLSYERSINKGIGIKAGYKSHNGALNGNYFYFEASSYKPYNSKDVYRFDNNTEEITYNITEFTIQTNFYRQSVGAIAPFGHYFGLELSGSRITPKQNNLTMGTISKLKDFEPDKIYGLNAALHYGRKRMITNEFGYFWDIATGFTLMQTAEISVFYYDFEGVNITPKEIIEHELAIQLAYSKIVQVSAGLTYLF